ncbi:MAG: membrane protein insertase YidC [Alphaproteobacteria bacterium]|nr:membrane protein insertase YidC [Alphaproteobacteria bacterium]
MVQYLNNNSGFNQWNSMQQNKPKKSMGIFGWILTFLLAWWVSGLFFQPSKKTEENTQTITIENSKAVKKNIDSDKISMDIQGLRLSDIKLKEHYNASENVVLLDKENDFIEVGLMSPDVKTPNINSNWELKNNSWHFNSDSNIHFVRDITIDGYIIKISDTIKNNSAKEISVSPYVQIARSGADSAYSSVVETGGVVYANSDLDYINWKNLDKKSYAYSSVRASLGFAEQYWETMVAIDANDQTISMKKIGDKYFANANVSPVKIMPKTSAVIDTFVFAGPRESVLLDSVSNRIPGINKTMDYGWFWFFAQPMLWTINWLYDFVGNYGVAIILMTLILRLLMWPLTRKSFASTMAMQKMQPELQRVQKLYANDKVRLQMEIMKVYQTHKTSPMSGCLPMLIQIPIFFALYKALIISVPMRSAHFLWISDLAAKDPYFILPILMGITMWLQQYLQTAKNSTQGNDAMASTQRVMKWMPILFTIMFAWMPAGLVLYWTISNVFGILQMYIIRKTLK